MQSRREQFRRRLYVAFRAVCRSRTRIRLRSLAPSDLAGRADHDEGRIAQIDRTHVTRNTSGSRRVTFASRLVYYPPDRPLQYTTPKPEPLQTVLHETTVFPPGLRQQVQQRLPAWEEIGAGS